MLSTVSDFSTSNVIVLPVKVFTDIVNFDRRCVTNGCGKCSDCVIGDCFQYPTNLDLEFMQLESVVSQHAVLTMSGKRQVNREEGGVNTQPAAQCCVQDMSDLYSRTLPHLFMERLALWDWHIPVNLHLLKVLSVFSSCLSKQCWVQLAGVHVVPCKLAVSFF